MQNVLLHYKICTHFLDHRIKTYFIIIKKMKKTLVKKINQVQTYQ